MSTLRQNDFITGWQLFVLGATSVVLSIASGWTTWDGMSNFTEEPALSFMITFGIQGVMLIAAWLIGDSFAKERVLRPQTGSSGRQVFAAGVGNALLVLLVLGIGLVMMTRFDLWPQGFEAIRSDLAFLSDPRVLSIAGLAVVALLTYAARDIVYGYLRALRIVAKHFVLWIMFLACMATSVFFSFDSLFSTIFSDEERARTADVRIRSETAAFISELADLTSRRQVEQRAALLDGDAWRDFAASLDELSAAAKAGPAAVDERLRQDLLTSQEAVSEAQSRLLALESDASQNAQSQQELSRKLAILRSQAAELQAQVDTLNKDIFEKDRDVIAKAAAAEAEATGVGESAIAGRGPRYRELSDQLTRLEAEKSNLELQLAAYRERLTEAQSAVTDAERQLAELKTAGERLAVRIQATDTTRDAGAQTDAANALKDKITAAAATLAGSRSEFERAPTRARLEALQAGCSGLLTTLSGAKLVSGPVAAFECRPGPVHEAAVDLYALNQGVQALAQTCSAASAPAGGNVDAQLSHARQCVQTARLSPADAAEIRAKIDRLERARDDLAHRFVVSANALSDGHNLAFLALAIAIAIDALVFMSGLFGAHVSRGANRPAGRQDPRADRYAAETIKSALLPNGFGTASRALELIVPASGPGRPGTLGAEWTHEVKLDEIEPQLQGEMKKLLNAGAATGRVRRNDKLRDHYYLQGDFVGLLCDAAQSTYAPQPAAPAADLPDLKTHAPMLLNYFTPSTRPGDHTHELKMADVTQEDASRVKSAMEALCALKFAQLTEADGDTAVYSIHDGFHSFLASSSTGRQDSDGQYAAGPEANLTDHLLASAAPRVTPAPRTRVKPHAVKARITPRSAAVLSGGNGIPGSATAGASPSATAVVGQVLRDPLPKSDA